MAAENDAPPVIEPVQQETILKNETPEIVSTAVSAVSVFLEKYGWFIILGIVASIYIWSKLEPYWRKWKERHDKKYEEANIDPARLARSQENMELARRRMQEKVNAQAAAHAEKMKEIEAQKRQEKIESWENTQKGQNRTKRVLNREYNPLSGSSSGSSFRPSRSGRRNTGGG